MRLRLRPPRPVEFALLGLVMVGVVMRLHRLSGQSFHVDEAYTLLVVKRPLGDVIDAVRTTESTPPLYYWLAWAWTQVTGTGEAGLRSLSLVFGAATIPAAYALGRELASVTAGILAAAFVAVNPFLVWYGQEGRSYALFVLLGTLSVLFAARTRRRSSHLRAPLLWAVTAGLSLLTHYFAAFLIGAEVLWLLPRRRDRPVLVATAVLLLEGAALIPLALAQRDNARFLADLNLGERVGGTAKEFALGVYASQLDSPPLVAAAFVLVALSAILVLASRRAHTAAAAPLGLAGFVVALPLVMALVGFDRFQARNVILALVLALVALAVTLGVCEWRAAAVAVGAGLLVLFAAISIAVPLTPRLERDDWRGVARALRGAPRPLAVVTAPGVGSVPLRLYEPRLQPLGGALRARAVAFVVVERPPPSPAIRLPGCRHSREVVLPSAHVEFLTCTRPTEISPGRLRAAAAAAGLRSLVPVTSQVPARQ